MLFLPFSGGSPRTSAGACASFVKQPCRALAFFDFALQTGDAEPVETARELLATGIRLADNAESVPLWWITNLCRHLIDDLWAHSLHENLPVVPPEGAEAEKYANIRQLFVGSLYARSNFGRRRERPPVDRRI
jgi:hypothetical protein